MRLTKTCSKCQFDKVLTEFGLSSVHSQGRQPWCRECKSEWSKNWSRKYQRPTFPRTEDAA